MYRLTCVTDNAKIRILLSLALATTRLSHRTAVARTRPAACYGLAPTEPRAKAGCCEGYPSRRFLIILLVNYYITFDELLYYFPPIIILLFPVPLIPQLRQPYPSPPPHESWGSGRLKAGPDTIWIGTKTKGKGGGYEGSPRRAGARRLGGLGTSSEICIFGML